MAKKSGSNDFCINFPYLNAIGFKLHHGETSRERASWHNGKFEQPGGHVRDEIDETRGCSMIVFGSYFILSRLQ